MREVQMAQRAKLLERLAIDAMVPPEPPPSADPADPDCAVLPAVPESEAVQTLGNAAAAAAGVEGGVRASPATGAGAEGESLLLFEQDQE